MTDRPGDDLGRIEYGLEMDTDDYEPFSDPRCPDCGAPKNDLHAVGCDVEQCPICRGTLIDCGHAEEVMSSAE